MADFLTRVEIVFYPEHRNDWLRFGAPDLHHDLDRRRSAAFFAPGRVFGYIRWRADEYGTRNWRFTIVRTAAPSLLLSRIQGVFPGGEVLLLARGTAQVKRALLQIDALETAGFNPGEVSPDYYRHVHNRTTTGEPVRAYAPAQHAVYRASLQVAS